MLIETWSCHARVVGVARARGLADSRLDVCRRSRVPLGGRPPPRNGMWWGPIA